MTALLLFIFEVIWINRNELNHPEGVHNVSEVKSKEVFQGTFSVG